MKKITIFYSILLILNLIGIICFQSISSFISTIFIVISYIFCRFDIRNYHIGLLNISTRRFKITDTFMTERCSLFRQRFLINRYCEIILKLERSDSARVKAGLSTKTKEDEFPLTLETILIFSPTNFVKRVYNDPYHRPDFLKEIEDKIIIHDNSKKSKEYSTHYKYIGMYYPLGVSNKDVSYGVYYRPIVSPSYFSEGMDRFIKYIKKRIESGKFDYEFNYIRNRYNRSREI